MTKEEQWFIKRYNAAVYGLLQMNMMGKDRTDENFKHLDDWINENEDKDYNLTKNLRIK